jgi:hypothetical protein
MKKILINNKEYDTSSPTSEDYKKKYIESFGDQLDLAAKDNPINLQLIEPSVDG